MKRKIWLITGISGGLGRALALAVMEKGDFITGTFRHQSQVDQFNEEYAGKGFSFILDVTAEDQVAKTVQEIVSAFGRIDVLVNNAGTGFAGAIEETSPEEVREVFEVNFFAALHLTRQVLPVMRRQKSGHIVQISSHGGVRAFAGFGIYSATKFALEGFSEALAQETAPLGIKVSIVEPGPFRTNFAGKGLGLAKNVIDDYLATAGVFREKLQGVNGKQEGDTDKAAAAIINHVDSDNLTLRLPLGKTAVLTIGMKINSLKADLEANREIAEGAVF